MKKTLAIAALAALIATPALAADLSRPMYTKAPPPPPPFSWTGCFVGGNGGGLFGRKEWTSATVGTAGLPIGSHDADSWMAGVQAGCDYQFMGTWVIGIQGDYDWTDATGTNLDQIAIGDTDRTHIKNIASLTGRIGYGWNQFLGYVRGGGAWVRDDYDVFVTATGAPAASASETRSGWTIGVGGEYAFAPWVSGFVEYDHYEFGTSRNTFITPAGGVFGVADIDQHVDVVKAGINFRFAPWVH